MYRYSAASAEEKKRRRNRICFFSLLILFSAALFLPDQSRGVASECSGLLQRVLAPIVSATGSVISGFRNWTGNWRDVRDVRQENRTLRLQLEYLQRVVAHLEVERRENIRLKQLLTMGGPRDSRTQTAKVIANGSNEMFQTVIIDKGRRSNIREDMAVVSGGAAVGKVIQATGDTAQVRLITDRDSGTGVMLDTSRLQGVVVGLSPRLCRMKYVPKLEKVRMGEKVITSGLDGVFPQGFLVGYVVKIGDGDGFFQEIEVEVASEFQKLEEVTVMGGSETRERKRR
jgi:rod shape-determining protein MreC